MTRQLQEPCLLCLLKVQFVTQSIVAAKFARLVAQEPGIPKQRKTTMVMQTRFALAKAVDQVMVQPQKVAVHQLPPALLISTTAPRANTKD